MRLARGQLATVAGVVAIVVLVPLLVSTFSEYWVTLCINAAIAAVLMSSIGVITDRAGMLAIAPMAFACAGAYMVGWCNAHGWPGNLYLWILLGGIAAAPVGVLVGLPALRLRGINLAVITLSFGVAVSTLIVRYEFPGYETGQYVERPLSVINDPQYFRLTWGVFVVICLVVWLIERRTTGSAWRSVARSERATAAMGMSVVRTKLGAFCISAFIAGIAGGLIVGQVGVAIAANFDPIAGLALVAAAIMVGAGNPEGALAGGLFYAFTPEILRRIGISQDFANILFAVGAAQALSLGTSVSGQWRRTARRLVRRSRARRGVAEPPAVLLDPPPSPPGRAGEGPAMRVRGLSVRYGNVVALNDLSIDIARGAVTGLIGPNGAGKSTFVDAVTGFIRGYEGSVELDGQSIDGLTVHRRAKAGVRRTFQQERTIPELTVAQYVRLAARRHITAAEISDVLAFVGGPPPGLPIAEVDVGARRLIEIAGCLASQPTVLLLDEPTAGLGQLESQAVAEAIAAMPQRYGCAVLLIEHDMEVVTTACAQVTALDFGTQIATGTPAEVLEHGAVVSAYLGDQAVTVA